MRLADDTRGYMEVRYLILLFMILIKLSISHISTIVNNGYFSPGKQNNQWHGVSRSGVIYHVPNSHFSVYTKQYSDKILSPNLTYRKEKSSLRFSAKQKIKNSDLPSQDGITPRLRESIRAEIRLIPCFLSQETAVLDAKNIGFIGKKRRNEPQETAVLETDSYFCKHQNRLSC